MGERVVIRQTRRFINFGPHERSVRLIHDVPRWLPHPEKSLIAAASLHRPTASRFVTAKQLAISFAAVEPNRR